jgi:tetratricopeptide (TPR) repeat protein
VTVPVEELIAEGRAALRAGDAGVARDAFERALAESANGDVLEGLARTSYLELDFPEAIAGWERAYAAHRNAGDPVGAVRVARTLA